MHSAGAQSGRVGDELNLQGTALTGVGLALMNSQKGSLSPPITGQIQVNPNGTITAFTGLTDHGAGGNTTLAILLLNLSA